MGARKAGSASFHADRDQVDGITRYVQNIGAMVEFLEPEYGVSGGKSIDERPALKQAIEGVEAGRYSGIVVGYLSRLTRSRSGIEIWDRVEAVGGHVHCAAENLDTSTPNGRFIRDIHLANAVREREEHALAHERRREEATRAGIWQRRQTPKGYDKHPETRRLVPNVEAPLVRWAFGVAGSVPLPEIADKLRMTRSGVRYLLRNRVYLGELRVGAYLNPSAHPPLIDQATFDAAQLDRPRPSRRKDRAPALLAGLVRCASCGHAMTRKNAATSNYACGYRGSGFRCPAPVGIAERLLDAHVWEIALTEARHAIVRATRSGGEVAEIRQRLADAEREEAVYLEAVSAAEIGADAFAQGARNRHATVVDLRELLDVALAAQAVPPEIRSGAEALAAVDPHRRNRLLRALFEAVVVYPVGRGRKVDPAERVRVLRHGAGVVAMKRGQASGGLRPIPLLDLDDERVLRVEFP